MPVITLPTSQRSACHVDLRARGRELGQQSDLKGGPKAGAFLLGRRSQRGRPGDRPGTEITLGFPTSHSGPGLDAPIGQGAGVKISTDSFPPHALVTSSHHDPAQLSLSQGGWRIPHAAAEITTHPSVTCRNSFSLSNREIGSHPRED